MIKLYKFGPAYGLRETGPFVLKLMAYMKLAGFHFLNIGRLILERLPRKRYPILSMRGRRLAIPLSSSNI